MNERTPHDAARALVRWYAEMGVNEAVGTGPADWFADIPAPVGIAETPAAHRRAAAVAALPAAMPADEAVEQAKQLAAEARSFGELEAAVNAFDGCSLKAGARNTVFADGVAGADLLVIGEAPGRDEDRIGKPFVGRAGQLLDRMLASIGRSRRTDTLISNVIFWRPPGNRAPTQIEIAICRPFVDRLVELTEPKAILITGGAPLAALFEISGIMRARGVWRDFETPSGARIPALPTLHPAFLLRQPREKRLAWSDLKALAARLRDG